MKKDFEELADLVDNGTTHVAVPTPEGWVCPRKNCTTDFLHRHGTYEFPKETTPNETT